MTVVGWGSEGSIRAYGQPCAGAAVRRPRQNRIGMAVEEDMHPPDLSELSSTGRIGCMIEEGGARL
ncbi:hypothetical protein GCM10007854_09570 [Algimonas porphyrae]|uniref:Uncharacterized protein n=1 Tax=Algimonas porphyrae TaxID=1128113 RepID=A0ABQ5V182_9PROT|nr:hypothetical protein GCM10007854_09570 [Algimonas porphyrae]